MPDDFSNALFARARDQYETAIRWSYIGLIVLLVFHLTTFAPFIDLSKDAAHTNLLITKLSDQKEVIEPLNSDLEQLKRESPQRATTELESVFKSLRASFGELNRIVFELRAMGPDGAMSSDGERVFHQMMAQDMNVQAGSTPVTRVQIPPMDPEQRRQIATIEARQELLESLQPYVETEIIAPQFRAFNERWTKEVLPRLNELEATIQEKLAHTQEEFGDDAVDWASMRASIDDAHEAGADLRLNPPDDPYWWSTVAGKDTQIRGRVATLREEMKRVLHQTDSLTRLQKHVAATLDKQTELQQQIASKLDDLDSQFKQQQAELASLVEPLKVVAFDLAIIAPKLPLLLGLILAALILWPAVRLRELISTTTLVARRSDDDLPVQWLNGRVGSVRNQRVFIIVRGLLFWIWIAFAALELSDLEIPAQDRTSLYVVVGMLAVAATSGYQWLAMRARK